jgi:hypothetical protein
MIHVIPSGSHLRTKVDEALAPARQSFKSPEKLPGLFVGEEQKYSGY